MTIWKDIQGYEGIYEVSNDGQVRSKEGKTTYTERHGVRVWKQRVLKNKKDKLGYSRITLYKEGKPKDFLVHRLVAQEYCYKPEGKDIINHKDGISSNNLHTNLEWCSALENVRHAFKNGLMGTNHITQLVHKESKKSLSFQSKAEASKFLKKSPGYISSLALRGKNETDNYWIVHKSSILIN